jgi:glycosyltransferase involved in cell wall biosynthesis
MPRLSVLMSVYNADRYITRAIASILSQTFKDFEFIIIDDGSTDKSLSILAKHAREDERIRIVCRHNTGLAKALNEALRLAKGEFIARMDADDIAMPERFERQIQYLENHPNCFALGCGVLKIDVDGDPINLMHLSQSHEEIETRLLKGDGGALSHPAAMMRRNAVLEVSGYREKFKMTEDLDLFLRLAQKGQLANLPDTLLHYRLHPKSVNFTKYNEQTQEVKLVLEEAYKSRGLQMPDNLLEHRFVQRTIVSYHHEWANMALRSGNLATARKHAILALYKAPFSSSLWRMVIHTIKLSLTQPLLAKLRTTQAH